MIPALVIFDVDKTINRSKQPIAPDMAVVFAKLLEKTRVAIMSGGLLSALKHIVVEQLPADANITNLSILPTSGAALYECTGDAWNEIYAETITPDEAKRIGGEIEVACAETGLIDVSSASYGDRIEYRSAQVTLSALGQEAPVDEKEAWDTDGQKKRMLRDAIAKKLPEYDVKTGGSTSVDVTKHGINKAYGVRKLSDHLSIPVSDMLYVGDALYPDGNDEVVKQTGIVTRQVADASETLQFITELLEHGGTPA
jgi:phosphomannomutase